MWLSYAQVAKQKRSYNNNNYSNHFDQQQQQQQLEWLASSGSAKWENLSKLLLELELRVCTHLRCNLAREILIKNNRPHLKYNMCIHICISLSPSLSPSLTLLDLCNEHEDRAEGAANWQRIY